MIIEAIAESLILFPCQKIGHALNPLTCPSHMLYILSREGVVNKLCKRGCVWVWVGVSTLTLIRLMAVMMSTLHVGLLISRLPMNCVCVCVWTW